MKSLKFLTVLFFTSTALFAQDIPSSQVPSVVLNQFNIDFPKAQDVDWKLENNDYNVDFEFNQGQDFEAWYSNSGKLLRLEEEISKSELPQAVVTAIKNKYSAYKIDDVEKITQNNTIYYEAELEKGDSEITVLFNKDGYSIN